jgi:hypothetical protein
MKPSSAFFAGALAVCALSVTAPTMSQASEVLITPQEAQLPPAKGAFSVATRGITRGPRIDYVSDPAGGLHSPIRLQLKFESFGGAKIDPATLKVTYLKDPAVDLTDRVKPFVQADGIDMPDAILPPGDHTLRVDVKDSDGRVATSSIVLKVAP